MKNIEAISSWFDMQIDIRKKNSMNVDKRVELKENNLNLKIKHLSQR